MRMALVLLLVACGSKASEPAITGSGAPKVVDDAAVATPPPQRKPVKAKPAPTKEQLAEQKTRMKAGWALQKESKWAEAVVEFEAALAAVADDQRALTELGWSAMNAGDFPKARKATEQAIGVAVDKKVKAAGLYNLGQIQEKTGDHAGAAKSYLASLELRPHPAVQQAMAKLGAKALAEPVFCAKGKKPCDCVLEHAFDESQRDQAKCEETTKPALPVKQAKLYAVSSDAYYGSNWVYALDEANQLIDVLEGANERGRLYENTRLEKAEVKTIAGHWVLWVETVTNSQTTHGSMDGDTMDTENWNARQVTLCVIGDDKTPTRCPLRHVPLVEAQERSRVDNEKATGSTTETKVELTIGDDGVATVKLVKGAADPRLAKLVGPHKLW